MNKLLVFGDFTTEGRGLQAIKDGVAVDKIIVQQIQSSDYSIINLETPIINIPSNPIKKVGPNLHSPSSALDYLSFIGIKGVTLANNHFCDYGYNGVVSTIEALLSKGFDYVGGGRDLVEKEKILYITLQEAKVAILNYCEHEFSIQDSFASNPLNPIKLFYDVNQAKENADFVICIVHGGHEGYPLPSPRMQELYRYMVDCGVSIVINHHQHCYSGFEKYNNGYIYYGLGNFFFDSKHDSDKLWTEGYYLSINIDKRNISSIELFPYSQCRGDKTVVELMDGDDLVRFHSDLDKLNETIVNEQALRESFDALCIEKKQNYLATMSPYSIRLLIALAKRHFIPSFITKSRKLKMYNYVRCESHRDLLEYALNY